MRKLFGLGFVWLVLAVGAAQVIAGPQSQGVDQAAVERGRAAFQAAGCLGCHTLGGDGRGTAVELAAAGHRLAYLMRENGTGATEAMESIFAGPPSMRAVRLRLSDDEVADVAAFVSTLQAPLVWDEYAPEEAAQGMAAFVNAGCAECHTVAGVGATLREEPIPLAGVREKATQQVVLQKLTFTNGGAVDPDRGMRNLWAATSEANQRLILAFVHALD